MKTLINGFLRLFGIEMRRIGHPNADGGFEALLKRVSDLGVIPATVIDVGVGHGTPGLYEAFPDSFHLLVEPLEEFEEAIKGILSKFKGDYVIAAAGKTVGRMQINVHTDHLEGSSLYKESMGSEADGEPRTIDVTTLDAIIDEKNLSPPYIIKVDVQGAEIDVLDGATKVLADTDLVLLEVSLFEFMKGGPLFYDIVHYMKGKGFVVYDIYSMTPRPLDGALGQVDLAFAKEDSILRKDHAYSSMEQWKEMAGG